MKKFILTISLLICSLFAFNQVELVFPSQSGGYNWQQVGVNCSGCSSFFVGINKTQYPNEYGNYSYSVYFQTNSFDSYGNPRMTYITDIYFYYYDQYGRWFTLDSNTPYWVLCANESYLGYSFFSPNPNLYVKIRIGNYVYR